MILEEVDLGPCRGFRFGTDGPAAVLLPGSIFGIATPALWYAREVLLARGWSVLAVHDDFAGGDADAWMRERAEAALARVDARLVLGKSMASRAAPLAAERGLPAVWLTPLLRDAVVAGAIAAAGAPRLLVGGTEDEHWDGAAARASGAEVLELPGADHTFALAGDPLGSIDVLRRAIGAVDAFVSRTGTAGV